MSHDLEPRRTRPAQTTMQAVGRTAYGSADQIAVRDIDVPRITDDEVLVRVGAAGLDRGVWHIMHGLPYAVRPVYGLRRPRSATLGGEVAGVVEAVGDAVTALRPGDEVFGVGSGSFAHFTRARPRSLARKPANLSFEQAAAVPISALTALQALRNRGRLESGQRVLVLGASGGVGTYAVQIAKALGAHVTGVCSAAKMDLVRSIGADEVIDYERDDLAGRDGSFDLILDIGGNRPLRQLRRLLTRMGTLVIVGGENGGPWFGGIDRQLRAMALSPFVRQRLGTFVATTNTADLEALTAMIEAGTVTPVIERVVSFAEVPDAIRDLESGRVRGKIVVTPPHR